MPSPQPMPGIVRRRSRRFCPVGEPLEGRIQLDGGGRFAAGIGVVVPPSVPDQDFHPYINAGAQAIDDAGNVYVAGSWRGGDLQFGAPAVATLSGVVDDRPSSSFVAKYSPQGGLLWSKAFEPRSLGGYAGNSNVAAIALDGQGGLYVTGTYSNSVDFDPGPGEAVLDQMASMYLLRLTSGGDLDWVHNLGEFGSDGDVGVSIVNEPTGMVVGDSGLVYITGKFAGSTVDFDPGPGVAQLSSNSNWGSPFIVQYHPDGSLGWARAVTGAANATVATPAEIAAVPGGGVAVAGSFRGSFDFDPGPAVDIRASNPEGAAFPADALFVMRLDAAGGLVWANTLRQPSNQGDNLNGYGVKALAVDGPGNVYMGGTLDVQLDFDPGAGTTILGDSPFERSYFVKFNSAGAIAWARDLPESEEFGLVLDELDRPVVAGRFPYWQPSLGTQPDVLPARPSDSLLLFRFDPATGRVAASRSVAGTVDLIQSLARGGSGAISILGTYSQTVGFGGTSLAPITTTRPGLGAYRGSVFIATVDPLADPPPAASLQLDPASDNGPSNHDRITSASVLAFEATAAPPGSRVDLFASYPTPGSNPADRGFVLVGSRTGPGPIRDEGSRGGGYEYDVEYRVQVVDPTRGYSSLSAPLLVHRDMMGPSQPMTPLQFFSISPDLPARVAPGSILTGFGGELGGSVQLLDQAGAILATGTVLMVDVPGLGLTAQYRIPVPAGLSGSRTLRIRALDPLGNASEPTAPAVVLIAAGTPGGGGGPGQIPNAAPPRLVSAAVVKKKGKQMIVLTFDRDLAPGPARFKGNYVLRGAGRDRRYNTRDDAKLKVKSAVHDAARRTVTLTPSKTVARNLPFRLTIHGLTGADGTPLDGALETNLGPMPKG